jgi:hypothetical protein
LAPVSFIIRFLSPGVSPFCPPPGIASVISKSSGLAAPGSLCVAVNSIFSLSLFNTLLSFYFDFDSGPADKLKPLPVLSDTFPHWEN